MKIKITSRKLLTKGIFSSTPFLAVLALIISQNVSGQNTIDLVFTAKHFGTYIELDSVVVENLSQGVDTILFNPDTALTLLPMVGMKELKKENLSFRLLQNYPNPIRNSTIVAVDIFRRSTISIRVLSLSGELILSEEQILEIGRTEFTLYPGKHQHLIFRISDKNSSQSIRMINNSSGDLPLQLNFKSYGTAETPVYKQDFFFYYLGDELRYTGYSTTANNEQAYDLIIDSPYESTLYVLNVKEGIACPEIPYLIYKGQLYNTVQIGSQCWMKENINAGVMIDVEQQQSGGGIIEKYCYNNDSSNCETYGGMYQLVEALYICPNGWHLPSGEEWEMLRDFLGGGSVAGGSLKSPDTTYWHPPNTGATNISGFSGLAGGVTYEGAPGTFHFGRLKSRAVFWSPTTYGSYGNGTWALNYDEQGFAMGYAFFGNKYSFSVRCIKNN